MPPTLYDLIPLAPRAIHKRGAIALVSGGMACLAHFLAPSFFLAPHPPLHWGVVHGLLA